MMLLFLFLGKSIMKRNHFIKHFKMCRNFVVVFLVELNPSNVVFLFSGCHCEMSDIKGVCVSGTSMGGRDRM